MKFPAGILVSSLFFALVSLSAQTPTPGASPTVKTYQPPDVAAPKMVNGSPDPKFIEAHDKFLKIAKENHSKLLFLGDSITAGWWKAPEVWKTFAAYDPADFGIKGDRTQHVLWRITNGELDGFTPKVVVLLIGTNNIGSKPEKIAGGITQIVGTIRQKVPTAKVLLFGIFPRGEMPGPQREAIKQVNALISRLDDGQAVFFLDIGDKFLEPDGKISKEVLIDFLHPTPKGYQIWADAMRPKLDELMSK